MRRARIKTAYATQYHDPIVMREGESVSIGERDTEFLGWVWCTDSGGKSGWCPERMLRFRDDGTAVFTQDYSARELDVTAGESVVVEHEESGWVWVTRDNGESGWVPSSVIALE